MIRMTGLRKTYRQGLLETDALSDFSLHVARGELVAVMGPSGSGKTTFLGVAGLLDDFDAGEYLLDGSDVRSLSDAKRSELRNRHIGFVFQSFNLIPDLDVFDNVETPLRYRRMARSERHARVEHVLQRVGLSARRHQLPRELSGGQQQRVAIARAIVTEPALILADEPTGNLDTHAASQILGLLQDINAAGTTIVMVTHAADLAARAKRRLHVLDGRVIDPNAPLLPRARAGATP
jgi:putative ABC transport system ATP-binding protein